MWMRWLPWRWVVSRMARSRGFMDPIAILSRLHRFAQPSEVTEPIELLRAGVVFHARGLINARAIQHNLDWVWPHWVERQFNPRDIAFVPRAFSITHVNLTHRNWTCVGLPEFDWLPIVDPRGMVTPMFDGWSIDAWVMLDDGRELIPSRSDETQQQLLLDQGVAMQTITPAGGATLHSRVEMVADTVPTCRVALTASTDARGFLAVTIRPANPEGVSFVHDLSADEAGRVIRINDEHTLRFDTPPQRVSMSTYHEGDVYQDLRTRGPRNKVHCDVGLATAAAIFPLEPGIDRAVTVSIAAPTRENGVRLTGQTPQKWPAALENHCRMSIPDERMQFLYDAAVRNLVLHSPGEVYPGPYTYKRFWFRDAAFILQALLALNLPERVRRCIDRFPQRQTGRGYFLSQEGEWDSNGAALWIMHRYCRMTGQTLPVPWLDPVRRGAGWIGHKRLSDAIDKPHAGLLPAGFSAEHLGPNDFYFWDDFWSIAGLESAAEMLDDAGDGAAAKRARAEGASLMRAVERAIDARAGERSLPGVPASPYRRLDAGAIGSIAAGYPLQLWDAEDRRLLDTAEFLLTRCTVHDGFFQDMIHSGINAYLTLHLAEVLLRAGERERAMRHIEAVADLASPTGQWPEAIHPATRGGCMGDGQHLWAAAEWVLMMRNLFIREEADRLIIAAGLPAAWLTPGKTLSIGPAPTLFGLVDLRMTCDDEGTRVDWRATWHSQPPKLEVHLPDAETIVVAGDDTGSVCVPRDAHAGASA
jgi:hypothetical protein